MAKKKTSKRGPEKEAVTMSADDRQRVRGWVDSYLLQRAPGGKVDHLMLGIYLQKLAARQPLMQKARLSAEVAGWREVGEAIVRSLTGTLDDGADRLQARLFIGTETGTSEQVPWFEATRDTYATWINRMRKQGNSIIRIAGRHARVLAFWDTVPECKTASDALRSIGKDPRHLDVTELPESKTGTGG